MYMRSFFGDLLSRRQTRRTSATSSPSASRPDRPPRSDDVCRQGPERGLRSARRLSDRHRDASLSPKPSRPSGADARIPAAGLGDRARHRVARRWSPTRTCAADAAPARADRQLDAAGVGPPPPFTVFEKTVTELQEAMTRGVVDNRRHRARVPARAWRTTIGTDRRSARCWRSIRGRSPTPRAATPSEPPAACAVRSTAIPVVFKDNIDALGAADDRRRAGARRSPAAARLARGRGHAAGGAVVLGKANLDEFPFGDFGISTVGGTIGNAYDPSLSTAGIERRQRHGRHREPRRRSGSAPTRATRSRTRRLRVARDDPDDARVDEPRRRHAAQHLQRCGRADGEVGARGRARARSGDRRRCGGSGDGRGGGAHQRLVRGRLSTRRRSRARASASSASGSSASPASARWPRSWSAWSANCSAAGRDGRRRRDSRLRRGVPRGARQRAGIAARPAGRPTSRAVRSRATAC